MEKILLDQKDLQHAASNALSLLGKSSYFLEAKFYPYSGLKATAKLRGEKISIKASEGFKAAGKRQAVAGGAGSFNSAGHRR